ncbi:hypothetical protein KDK95_20225 [Actinospica sp. MGRD01-02]|uniref:Uncharacterized protein n=1 Tax=Actinospica acidithermotolerans TaxID=2828514 RepID=A0A941EC95_9ACTN|nr:hypothetical protein [Actinospica acidithermotolerans]MBR7828647.1 hypothetical protein [Actinospica acidithermotolerans]
MAADELLAKIQSWKNEDSHRGRLVRAFNSNYLNDVKLQTERMGMLLIHVERDAALA